MLSRAMGTPAGEPVMAGPLAWQAASPATSATGDETSEMPDFDHRDLVVLILVGNEVLSLRGGRVQFSAALRTAAASRSSPITASPAARPQKADPIPNRDNPDAVTASVSTAGKRLASSASAEARAPAKAPISAKPATVLISSGGRAAMMAIRLALKAAKTR